MHSFLLFMTTAVSAAAYPNLLQGSGKAHEFTFWQRQDGTFQGTGVASFNSYADQDNFSTACGKGRGKPTVGDPNASPQDKIYAAGLNDLSDIWASLVGPGPDNRCGGADPSPPSKPLNDTSRCTKGPFTGPPCPTAFANNICNTPTCFQITNNGKYAGKDQPGGQIDGIGNKVMVQLVDACPRNHMNNFCNTDGSPRTDRADERCEDNNRQFDIDTTAFATLTSASAGSPQDLAISMVKIDCPPAN